MVLAGSIFIGPLHASFEPLPMGARAAGMGEAFSAIVDDVFALYYNPAGVLQMTRPEIGTHYASLYSGLSDNSSISRTFLGYAQPLGKQGSKGHFGASYAALELSGLYKEESIGLTYGKDFRRRLNIGGTLKLLNKKIGSDANTNNAINPVTGNPTGSADPLLASSNKESAFAVDLGFQYRLSPAYAFGTAFRNVNSPNLGLGSQADKAPAVYSAALARVLRTGSLDIEFMSWKGAVNNSRVSIGGEKWFKNGFALRAGGGLGNRNYATVSAGASFRMDSFQLDYATVLPLQGIQGTLGIQQVSLIVRLGKPPVDPLEKQLIQEKEERIRAETEARYAKAETDRLKKQLLELTQAKNQQQKNREQAIAAEALREAEVQKEKASAQSQDQTKQNFLNNYTQDLSEYNDKVRSGITLKEKKNLLQGILDKYKNKGIDLSTIERELSSIRSEEAQAKKDFELSMSFYRRLAQQGAGSSDRRGMLKRIIEKYKDTGINIQSALEEMETLP